MLQINTFEYSVEIESPIETVVQFDPNPEDWVQTMPSKQNLETIEEADNSGQLHSPTIAFV